MAEWRWVRRRRVEEDSIRASVELKVSLKRNSLSEELRHTSKCIFQSTDEENYCEGGSTLPCLFAGSFSGNSVQVPEHNPVTRAWPAFQSCRDAALTVSEAGHVTTLGAWRLLMLLRG